MATLASMSVWSQRFSSKHFGNRIIHEEFCDSTCRTGSKRTRNICPSKPVCSEAGRQNERKIKADIKEIHVTFGRRNYILGTLALSAIIFQETPAGAAIESVVDDPPKVKYDVATDELNAYTFKFPVNVPSTQEAISWVETRKPERYSSAAPLSADARQRIVAERLDFRKNIVLSVTIGPPNEAFLRGSPSEWPALSVAKSVLVDKSTDRLTPAQRLKEIDIGDVSKAEIDGETYWYYENLEQKSPTISDASPDVFRHFLAVSATREGYIYTLSMSCLQSVWPKFEPGIREAINSFRLTPVTSEYVPPWKDPWRFW